MTNHSWDVHAVLRGDATGGSVPAVEPVLQVNARLPDQIVPSHQVVVIDQHRQQRLLRKLGVHLKGSDGTISFEIVSGF